MEWTNIISPQLHYGNAKKTAAALLDPLPMHIHICTSTACDCGNAECAKREPQLSHALKYKLSILNNIMYGWHRIITVSAKSQMLVFGFMKQTITYPKSEQ